MKRPSEYTFAAVFEKEADGRYSVSFPQLEGCFTEGDTFEDARRMAVDAMSLHLYGMEQDGETIPKANLELHVHYRSMWSYFWIPFYTVTTDGTLYEV